MSFQKRQRVTGRRESYTFIALPKVIVNSPEYACLSAYAVKLFFDLFAQFNGRNNGDLCAAWTLMRGCGWRSKATLHRALKELRDNDWIIVARQGGRNKATLYALTHLPVNECGGKLDISETVLPLRSWKHGKFCASFANQVSTPAGLN